MTALLDLTLVDPAEILAMAARLNSGEIPMGDEAWRLTPIGRRVTDYLNEQRFQNYAEKTIQGRQDVLRILAIDLAYLEPGEVTLGHLKTFLAARWDHAAVNTKATYTSHVRAFFQWLEDNEQVTISPARKLRTPRRTDTEKRAYGQDAIRHLVLAQDGERERDRVAVLLMYWCALRRNELRQVQFRHLDLTHRLLTVFGKGGKIIEQSVPGAFALDLERYILNRQPAPDEFLLHPRHDRLKPYSSSGIDKWFQRCRGRAGFAVCMHELRHSAGTHFHQEGHDLVATQMFLRHANPATTAQTYVHLDRARAISDVQRRMADPMDEDA